MHTTGDVPAELKPGFDREHRVFLVRDGCGLRAIEPTGLSREPAGFRLPAEPEDGEPASLLGVAAQGAANAWTCARELGARVWAEACEDDGLPLVFLIVGIVLGATLVLVRQ